MHYRFLGSWAAVARRMRRPNGVAYTVGGIYGAVAQYRREHGDTLPDPNMPTVIKHKVATPNLFNGKKRKRVV